MLHDRRTSTTVLRVAGRWKTLTEYSLLQLRCFFDLNAFRRSFYIANIFRRAINRYVHLYFPVCCEKHWSWYWYCSETFRFYGLWIGGTFRNIATYWLLLDAQQNIFTKQWGKYIFLYLIFHSRLSVFDHTSTFTVTAVTYTHISLPIVCLDLTVMEERVPPTVRAPD
jgi:hypothetical protein